MKLWGYYAWHTFRNMIRKIFKSKAIITFLMIILIGGISGGMAAFVTHAVKQQNRTNVTSEKKTVKKVEKKKKVQKKNPAKAADMKNTVIYIEAGAGLLFLIMILWGIYSGSKSGTQIFQMADVNFLFMAPMKPQSVLMFRLSFQMAMSLLASAYILLQLPNLVVNAGISVCAVLGLILCWCLILVIQRLIAVLSYTVFATYEHLKKYVFRFVAAIAAVVLGSLAIVYFAVGQDVHRLAGATFGSRWMRGIPFIGWFKAMIVCSINEQMKSYLVYLSLTLIGILGVVVLIWKIRADFYEDAMTAAGKTQELTEAAKEGRMIQTEEHSRKEKRSGVLKGFGAEVFLSKEMMCRKRTAKFGIITKTMMVYLLLGIGMYFLMLKGVVAKGFLGTGVILLLILFFRNFGNPIAQETQKNWIFLVPDKPVRKVFYAMMAGTCGCVLDLFPLMIVGSVLLKENPGIMLMWYLTLVVMDFMLSATGLLIDVIVPVNGVDTLKVMVQMLFQFLFFGAIVVLAVIVYQFGGIVAALCIPVIMGVLVGLLSLSIYPHCLRNGIL